ncbi:MAG TPA: TonB-dependent receptor plug domain-containing protein, partial [Solimonas sp.]|nr:TonB-dependent receptor plug domain-containing protein [Solimonas sp.]
MPKLENTRALLQVACLIGGVIATTASAAEGDGSDPLATTATVPAAAAEPENQSADETAAAPLPTIPLPDHAPPAVPVADKPAEAPIDEIIVTAQKREQRLQDVPVAVTVIGKKQLEQQNISRTEDLARAAPAVEVYGEPGNPDTKLSIRGISTQSFSVTSEQAVSFVADGVVLGRAPSVSLFDVAQVEVLRGPQGTLFGKNSSAGVISVT